MLRLYTDGGVIGRNPSALGGTWAWCVVSEQGHCLRHESGVVTPLEIGLANVTNNYTELLAAVLGLETFQAELWPECLQCRWLTDSGVTLRRLTNGEKWHGIPEALKQRALRCRAAIASATLLGGHPNRKELACGVRKDGKPVSVHNVWCDQQCTRLARQFKLAKGVA